MLETVFADAQAKYQVASCSLIVPSIHPSSSLVHTFSYPSPILTRSYSYFPLSLHHPYLLIIPSIHPPSSLVHTSSYPSTTLTPSILPYPLSTMQPRDYLTKRLRDYATTRPRDYATTRPPDQATTRPHDYTTTRLRDHTTTLHDKITITSCHRTKQSSYLTGNPFATSAKQKRGSSRLYGRWLQFFSVRNIPHFERIS